MVRRISFPHPAQPARTLAQSLQGTWLPISIAKYYAMCTWFDETCGQLIDLLEKRNLRDDTIIVYVTDNDDPEPRKRRICPAQANPLRGGIRTPICSPGQMAN